MPSIINATTTNGVAISPDNSGSLQLATNNGTTAVTIDTSQNVGIGTTSPASRLAILENTNGNSILNVRNTNAGSSATSILGLGNDGALNGAYLVLNSSTNTSGGAGNSLNITNGFNAPMTFGTNGTERMRISSSGDVLVGTTNTAPNAGVGVKIGSDGAEGFVQIVGNTSTNGNVTYRLYSTNAAAYRFYVGYGGTVYATSTTITALSDARLKENIQDIDVGLDKVMALKPRKFDWKTGKGKDIKNDRGWIAQEFEQVFPEMIDTWKDPAPEGEEPYKAVNADLIPVLVKAIQELKAELDEVKAELDATKAEVQALKGVA